jgi:PKD repeat protein
VTVTDDDGDSDTAQTTATVANIAPTADAGGPYSGVAGTAMQCSGGVSDPGSADTHTFRWDFGDGGNGTGQSPTHTYAAAGSYTVTLTVTDDDGDSDTDSATVNVSEPGQGGDPDTIASDDFESRNYSGGTGAWAGAWEAQGDVRISSWGGAHSGRSHALLRRNTGQLQRTVELAGATGVSLRFWARVRSFEGSDQAFVRVSPDGVDFTTVKTFDAADSDNTYRFYEIDVTGFAMTDDFVIRFDAEMSSRRDYLYIDDVEVYGVAGD